MVLLTIEIGPREISINRYSAIQIVYGPPSTLHKSTWYSQVSDDAKKCSLNDIRDLELHRLRRRAWDRGFSGKGSLACMLASGRGHILTLHHSSGNISAARSSQNRFPPISNCGTKGSTSEHYRVVYVLFI